MDILKQNLAAPVYDKLIEANLNSLQDIIKTSNITLCQNTKLSLAEVEQIVETAASIILEDRIKPASEVPQWERLSTGCFRIDSIIRGGIPINGIAEIAGASGVGKTQFCLQLALMVQFPTALGGLGKGAVYICTEDHFPSKRFSSLCKAFPQRFTQLPSCNYSDNVFLEHIADYEQLHRCLCNKLPGLLAQKNIGIIIIDSIAGVFRSENLLVNYWNRGKELFTIASKLNSLQDEFHTAIVCVNQVTCNIETGKTEPCLGFAWSNMVTCRFVITKNELGSIRSFNVEFAPDLPNNYSDFSINDTGIVDVFC